MSCPLRALPSLAPRGAPLSSSVDDKYALIVWELALEAGRLGRGVSAEAFARVVDTKEKGSERPGRKVKLDAVRQAFKRLRVWCAEHGLDLKKEACEGDGLSRVTFDVIFDPAAALALAVKIRPRLSRSVGARVGETGRRSARVRSTSRAAPAEPPSERLITIKAAASLLDMNTEVLRRKLAARKAPIDTVYLDARVVRVRLADVQAWVLRSSRRGRAC